MDFFRRFTISRNHLIAVSSVSLLGLIVMFSALGGPPVHTSFYVVKWKLSGKCTVVEERPENRLAYRTLWFSSMKKIAYRKTTEFRETGKCL